MTVRIIFSGTARSLHDGLFARLVWVRGALYGGQYYLRVQECKAEEKAGEIRAEIIAEIKVANSVQGDVLSVISLSPDKSHIAFGVGSVGGRDLISLKFGH